MPHTTIEKVKRLHQFLLGHVKDLSPAQLNTIPPGFNNNIIWHLGHLVSSLQRICYFRSGLPMPVDDKFITPFASGTKPEQVISDKDIIQIRELLVSTVNELQSDFDRNIFQTYAPSEMVKTVYGVTLENIDDAFEFVLFHVGLHTGYILAIKRLV